MLRSLYFTWDQLTGPYLNAHSLLGCSTGALGNFERRGRSWFFLWPFLVEVGRSLGNDISFKTEPQSNQVDSHWSISSIKSLLQCHHNTNQNYNISEMFRNHGFGSTIGYCVDLLNDFFFSKQNGVQNGVLGAQEVPSKSPGWRVSCGRFKIFVAGFEMTNWRVSLWKIDFENPCGEFHMVNG